MKRIKKDFCKTKPAAVQVFCKQNAWQTKSYRNVFTLPQINPTIAFINCYNIQINSIHAIIKYSKYHIIHSYY